MRNVYQLNLVLRTSLFGKALQIYLEYYIGLYCAARYRESLSLAILRFSPNYVFSPNYPFFLVQLDTS